MANQGTAFFAGEKVRASYLNNLPSNAVGGWVATGSADIVTSANPGTTETDLGTRCRTGSIQFVSGHLYAATLNMQINGATTGDIWDFFLRINAPVGGGGSTLFPNSSAQTRAQVYVTIGGDDSTFTQTFLYPAVSTFQSQIYTSYCHPSGGGTGAMAHIWGNNACSLIVVDYGANSGIIST
jgi:hypothetical protein